MRKSVFLKILALLVMCLLALNGAGCGKSPGTAADAARRLWRFVPDDPNYLFVARLDLLRGKEYARDLEQRIRETLPGWRLGADDIDEILVAEDYDGGSNITIVVRTARDTKIEDVIRPYERNQLATRAGRQVLISENGFFPGVKITRIDDRTFLFYRGTDRRLDATLQADRVPKLGEEFRSVLDRVSSSDTFLVVAPINYKGENNILSVFRANGLRLKGEGVAFRGSIGYLGVMMMESAETAENWFSKKENQELAATYGIKWKREGARIEMDAEWREFAEFKRILCGDGMPIISRPCF